MEDILKSLYYGELRPCEKTDIQKESFRQARAAYDEAATKFKASLSETQLEEFEQLAYIKNDYDREYDVLNFKNGFQLGVKLTLAGLGADKPKTTE